MTKKLPKGVTYDVGGLTVHKAQTGAEIRNTLFFMALALGGIGACIFLGFPQITVSLPDGVRPWLVELFAQCLTASPVVIPVVLWILWRFATQPVLRLTQHTITLGPRWAWWRPSERFQLGSVTIEGTREPWEEGTARAVLCLTEGDRTAKLPLEPIVEGATQTGAAKLDWVVRELKLAQAAFGQSEEHKAAATGALAALRGRARKGDRSEP